MKHLKKILIAITLVVLLVSSAVFVVTAADDAQVEELNKMYNNIDLYPELKDKVSQIVKIYEFAKDNKIDHEDDSVKDLFKDVYKKNVELGQETFAQLATMTSTFERIALLNEIYAHYDAYPPAADTEGYAALMADVDAKNVELIGILYEEANASGIALFKQQTIYATIFEQLHGMQDATLHRFQAVGKVRYGALEYYV